MQDWRTIKVPAWAAEQAEKLKQRLRRVGTEALPQDMRPDGPLTFGHIFTVGIGAMNEALARSEMTKRRRK